MKSGIKKRKSISSSRAHTHAMHSAIQSIGFSIIGSGRSARQVFKILTEVIDREFPGSTTIFYLTSPKLPRKLIAPNLSRNLEKQIQALKPIEFQKLFYKQEVSKMLIASHTINSRPTSQKLKLLFSETEFKKIHSLPILDKNGKSLGIISLLSKSPEPLNPSQLSDLTFASQISLLAIEREKEVQAIKKLKARLASEDEEPTQKMREAIRQLQDEIVQRKIMERSLKTSNEKLQNLSNHLENVREEERTRISREIHDELGQMLTTLKMKLSILEERTLDEGFPIQDDIHSMMGLVETTLQTVRRISTELRPGILDVLGLSEAVEWQSQEFNEQTKIKIETNIQRLPEFIGKDLSTACFRICQEALTNVARHAEATLVTVSLKHDQGKLELIVRDNGKGITNEQLSRITSLGLIGMRERAQNLGGDLNIERADPTGTEVSISFPLDLAD